MLKNPFVGFFRSVLIACFALLGTACTFSFNYGLYACSDCPGWIREYNGRGGYQYMPPDRHNQLSVVVGSEKKGELFFRINLANKGPVVFLEKKIKILVSGSDETRETDAVETTTLTVPEDKDFTVVIPSFRAGEDLRPELRVRCHWSDRRVWHINPVFAP